MPVEQTSPVLKIAYFQLNNLIQNRIPFCFVQMGVQINGWYSGVQLLHIQNYSLQLPQDTNAAECLSATQNFLQERQWTLHGAIVTLCHNEKISAQLAQDLEKSGYTNVYCIQNGLDGLVQEKTLEES
ncbi:MAG: hypothetical protein ACOYOK_02410 [Pseudobdellovibrionaceae bacterium]